MHWLASNIRTFLLALVLGASVWLSAVTGADPDEVRPFPNPVTLEVIGQDPSLILTSEIPPTIEVTLRAPRTVWEQLIAQENSVQGILDITGLSAGEHTQVIQIRIGARPAKTVLTTPETITFTLEPLSTQSLPVEIIVNGQPAVGYQAGEATVEPTQIAISGPESIVRQATRARVSVSLDDVRESIDEVFDVQVLDDRNIILNGVSINPQTARVMIPISPQSGYRDLAVKVVVNGQQAPGYRLENISVFPPVITVFAEDPELVNGLPGVVETQALDLQNAKENISTRLALTLPETVTIVGTKTVQVQVAISPIQTSLTLLDQPINIIGLPDGFAAQISPQTVDVIISGPQPVLNALTPQDITVSIDVTGLDLGTHQLEPKVEVFVEDVLKGSILPGTVEVVLSILGTPTPISTP
ncbi:MAG TPA: CdaR family protein [Anaerolineales bacterium]|jgi:YbbR domain-containing protein|nr:CdaR family protein [Anaerolineales bacterium]